MCYQLVDNNCKVLLVNFHVKRGNHISQEIFITIYCVGIIFIQNHGNSY